MVAVMADGDRVSRLWLAILTLFMVFQVPLMNHKLAMACNSALEALKGSRQTRLEVEAIRAQLRTDEKDLKRDPITIDTTLEPQ